MRRSLFALLFLLHFSVLAQNPFPNQFALGNFLQVLPGDSIKVYFDCGGNIADKACAQYYRIGKIDPAIINVTGPFTDYYLNGEVYLKASMLQNRLDGEATYFYSNGNTKEQGHYKNGVRDGKWHYFYNNGKPEKTLLFVNGEPKVLDFFSKGGKALVANGSGKYNTHYSTTVNCTPFEVFGEVKDGVKHGKWYIKNQGAQRYMAEETYDNGKFLSGKTGSREYTQGPKIGWSVLIGSENVKLLDNRYVYSCRARTYRPLQYQGQGLHQAFYPNLTTQLNNYNASAKDQWLIVGLQLTAQNKLSSIQVFSSIEDSALEKYVHGQIAQMTQWETALVDSKPVELTIFFTALVMNQQIIIPAHFMSMEAGKQLRKAFEQK